MNKISNEELKYKVGGCFIYVILESSKYDLDWENISDML